MPKGEAGWRIRRRARPVTGVILQGSHNCNETGYCCRVQRILLLCPGSGTRSANRVFDPLVWSKVSGDGMTTRTETHRHSFLGAFCLGGKRYFLVETVGNSWLTPQAQAPCSRRTGIMTLETCFIGPPFSAPRSYRRLISSCAPRRHNLRLASVDFRWRNISKATRDF